MRDRSFRDDRQPRQPFAPAHDRRRRVGSRRRCRRITSGTSGPSRPSSAGRRDQDTSADPCSSPVRSLWRCPVDASRIAPLAQRSSTGIPECEVCARTKAPTPKRSVDGAKNMARLRTFRPRPIANGSPVSRPPLPKPKCVRSDVCRLKDFRRIATHCDRSATNFLAEYAWRRSATGYESEASKH